ncbi:WecB/TagA/CpsF family glycosyltransferase [soil metagenome]
MALPEFETMSVLGYRLAALGRDGAAAWCLAAVRDAEPKLLVTLNPEIIVSARGDPALEAALQSAELTVADGVGVLWAAKQFGVLLPERVPGVELTAEVLRRGGDALRVYFLGAKPGVAARAARAAAARFGTRTAGVQHGYFKPDEVPEVVHAVAASGANLLLAGLGEGQERFLHGHREAMGVALMIGVGGSLDVLAGEVRRTPAWTRWLGVEWAWRVGLDRRRWHRFPRLLRFVKLVRREKAAVRRHS